jgi:hypothetical protein
MQEWFREKTDDKHSVTKSDLELLKATITERFEHTCLMVETFQQKS